MILLWQSTAGSARRNIYCRVRSRNSCSTIASATPCVCVLVIVSQDTPSRRSGYPHRPEWGKKRTHKLMQVDVVSIFE